MYIPYLPIAYCIIFLAYSLTLYVTDTVRIEHVVGFCITFVSFALWILARIQLGKSFSIAPEAKKLVTHGLYSRLRHPIYYFSISAVAGLAIMSWNWYGLAIFVLVVALEIPRIRAEEKLLQKKI